MVEKQKSSRLKKKQFYVYVYLDPRKPGQFVYGDYQFEYQPFYVGKGSGLRKDSHLWEAQKTVTRNHKLNLIRKIIREGYKPEVIIVEDHLTENQAYKVEDSTIRTIGMSRDKSGPLANQKCGENGGGSGKYNVMYGVSRKQRFINKYGKRLGEKKYKEFQAKGYATRKSREYPNGMQGKKYLEVMIKKYGVRKGTQRYWDAKRKSAEARTGVPCSEERRTAISIAKKGNHPRPVTFYEGCISTKQGGQVVENGQEVGRLYTKDLYSIDMLATHFKVPKGVIHRTFKALNLRARPPGHATRISGRSKGRTGEKNATAKTWKVVDPTGKEYTLKGTIREFCEQHGLLYNGLRNRLGKVYVMHPNTAKRDLPLKRNTVGWTLFQV